MEKIKTAFLDMLNNNKMKLYMFILYTVTFLFMFLSFFLPFVIDPAIDYNGVIGRLSLSNFPIAGLIIIGYVVLFGLSLYHFVLDKNKFAKLFQLVAIIIITLYYLFMILVRSQFPNPRGGLGSFLLFIFIIISWLEIFASKFIEKLIEKNVPKVLEKIESLKKEEAQDTIAEVNVEEPATKPADEEKPDAVEPAEEKPE